MFLNVAQFDDASAAHQKPTWYSKLFGVTIPLGNETPSLQAVARIGEYYKTGSHPRLTGSVDPIILSCSKNFHLFFTDGYTNEAAVPTDVVPHDQDNTVPTYPYFATAPISGLVPGAAWPHPFQEDAASELTQNALSDYAMYYWVTDLQHSGPAAHNVLATATDPATWQHQNFAAISLGTTGKLPTAQQSVTEAALAAGSLKWPVPSPNVFHPDNSGVDDLWHAAINGRSQFVNAQSVDEVKLGIGQVLADVASQAGARAGAGLQSTSVGASSNFIYRARFEPGWAGSLTKEQIDPHTGLKVAEVWKAATQLAAQLAVGAPPNDKPWFTNRKIVTMNEAGTAVPFLWDNIGNEQRDSLFPPNTLSKVAREKAIVEFLRGNAANEGTKLGQFRKRNAFLGDIVNTSPVFVGVKPNAAYRDGAYLAKIDVEKGRKAHFSSGRWGTDQDRASFIAGYEHSYKTLMEAIKSEPSASELAGYRDGVMDGARHRLAAQPFQVSKTENYRKAGGYQANTGLDQQDYRAAYSNGYQEGYYLPQESAELRTISKN